MKNSTLLSAAIASVFLLSLSAAHADEQASNDAFTGNVSGLTGTKSLYEKDWGEFDQQSNCGVIFDIKKQSWPISIAFDVMASADIEDYGSEEDLAVTVENHIGVRKVFDLSDSAFKPYVGGGIAFVSARIEHELNGKKVSESDDHATGYWYGMGTYYAVTDHFNLGADLRFSNAEVTLFDKDRAAGGTYAGISAGYHW